MNRAVTASSIGSGMLRCVRFKNVILCHEYNRQSLQGSSINVCLLNPRELVYLILEASGWMMDSTVYFTHSGKLKVSYISI